MLQSLRFALFVSVAVLIVASGCRTYGGYGTEPKTYEALESTVQSFEEDLDRAQADLKRLEEAASELDTLHALADEFHSHIEEHRFLLEDQRHRLETLSPNGSYRDLHEAYGATVTERRMLRQKYQRTIRNVQVLLSGPASASASKQSSARHYTVTPIGFPDGDSSRVLTMERALRGL